MTSNAKSQPEERARAQRCLDMKLQGNTWTVIAEVEGYADRSGPRHAVERLLDRVESARVADYREVEAARLDALQAMHWKAALTGDLKSAEFVLKVSAQRTKLLGLAVPEKLILSQQEMPTDEDFAAIFATMMRDMGFTPPPTIDRSSTPTETTDTDMSTWIHVSGTNDGTN
ncbi:hypothetical protein ACSW29_12575 [Rhodococcus sp. GB-02]